jgi:hypothetical protein
VRSTRFPFVCCLAACLVAWAGSGLRAGDNAKTGAEEQSAYLEDLLSILDETKSPDAFMLTLRCLDDDKADPRVLIPAAIRNAERLGILRDHGGKEGRKQERAETFAELLEHIHKRMPKVAATRVTAEPTKKPCAGGSVCNTTILEGFDPEGPAPSCGEAPSEAAILRKMRSPSHGVSWLCKTTRDDVQIVTELVKDEFVPVRYFPLVGPARLHHCHWKCTVYYNETIEGTFPLPYRCVRPRVEVVYLDDDKLYVEQEHKNVAD